MLHVFLTLHIGHIAAPYHENDNILCRKNNTNILAAAKTHSFYAYYGALMSVVYCIIHPPFSYTDKPSDFRKRKKVKYISIYLHCLFDLVLSKMLWSTLKSN